MTGVRYSAPGTACTERTPHNNGLSGRHPSGDVPRWLDHSQRHFSVIFSFSHRNRLISGVIECLESGQMRGSSDHSPGVYALQLEPVVGRWFSKSDRKINRCFSPTRATPGRNAISPGKRPGREGTTANRPVPGSRNSSTSLPVVSDESPDQGTKLEDNYQFHGARKLRGAGLRPHNPGVGTAKLEGGSGCYCRSGSLVTCEATSEIATLCSVEIRRLR